MYIDKWLFADKTPKILQKALDLQSERQMLISSNISNLDTPEYQAKDIDFKGAMREALGAGNGLGMKVTHNRHLGSGNSDISSIQGEVFSEPDTPKTNGNNVNIDKEMMKLAENQIAYNASIQMLAKRQSILRTAITENVQG